MLSSVALLRLSKLESNYLEGTLGMNERKINSTCTYMHLNVEELL